MGSCATSRKNIDIITISTSINYIILIKIKENIKSNKFKEINLKTFKDKLNLSLPKRLSLTDDINYSKEIKFFINLFNFNKLELHIIFDILTISIKNLSKILPSTSVFQCSCYILYYFLSKQDQENIYNRKQFLLLLFELCINDEILKNENYNKNVLTTKFTFLVIFIIIDLSYILIYFFISKVFLLYTEKFTEEDINVLFIEKKCVKNINPKVFSTFIYGKIKDININFSGENILNIVSYYIFNPIKDKIDINYLNNDKIVLEEKNINDIIDRLDYFFNPDNMLEIIFKSKIKDY